MLPVLLLMAQSYSGPPPAKADVPYLLHAGNLVQTEITEAKETKSGDTSVFSLPGANSPVKTPLASPILIILASKILPDQLQVFALASHEGRREITFSRRNPPQTYTLTVKPLKGNQYRLEVNESLPVGEYALTPTGSNQAFCFAVF
jgi:hypothetical protein